MDSLVKRGSISEGLMGEMMRLEVVPDDLNVVEFGRIFGQPFDRDPVRAGGKGRHRSLARMDRPIVLNQHDRRERPAGHRTVEQVKLLKMSDEVTAALGRTGVDDELARDVIERTQHRDFLGLSRRRNAQVRADLGPNPGEIGMCQRFTLVAVQKHDIAGFGLALAQLQTQTDPIHLVCDLPSLQRVPRAPPTELFFRNALDNCERLMRTPSVFSISARSRAIVQFGRLATGASSNGVTTRRAVSLFTGSGPGATLAFNASTPLRMKSLRHSRTVSSRTPNASAIRGLVQPDSVNSTARARSASPRSREPAKADNVTRWSSVAVTGDFPLMAHLSESVLAANRKTDPLVNPSESA